MNLKTVVVRKGYNGKKCLVHARCCVMPSGKLIATAQELDVSGMDLFDGIKLATSDDGGKTWSDFEVQEGLKPVDFGTHRMVACDMTPMYHKKTGKVILLGHTACYANNENAPADGKCTTSYSVYDEENNRFSDVKFVDMPMEYTDSGNGCGQSIEKKDGTLLIPIYFKAGEFYKSAVMHCVFDGEEIRVLEIGKPVELCIARGCYEPSVIEHKGVYYMTLRNDMCSLVAESTDGLNYSGLKLWCWDDGSILQSYNTQQHWLKIEDELYLVYTRRGADNDHVFRHRAPLFVAKVENMKLVKESEFVAVKERGARLGNFCALSKEDGTALVMAAEWMQPKGCEKYGSDNSVHLTFIKK